MDFWSWLINLLNQLFGNYNTKMTLLPKTQTATIKGTATITSLSALVPTTMIITPSATTGTVGDTLTINVTLQT